MLLCKREVRALMYLPGLRLLTAMKKERPGSSCPVLPRASSFWTDWELVLRGSAGEQDPARVLGLTGPM